MDSSINDFETKIEGRWQWKSNPNPWLKTEPPQWEFYTPHHNEMIEKAYINHQKEVDLGDYIVSLSDLLQRRKGNPQAQRQIQRIGCMQGEEINDRSSRYFDTELPKTINKIFGSLGDFIGFFARRSPEMQNFKKEFEEFEKCKDLNLLKKNIIPYLISCLQEELPSPTLEQLQDTSLSVLKKKVLKNIKASHEKLISLFDKDFLNIEDFYEQILRSYTMETSLYRNLNKYLRNESWIEIGNLLPYAFCLCKAFFNLKPQKNNVIMEKDTLSERARPITLYRGTAFNESELNCYNPNGVQKEFSWYSVTSTSTNLNVAQGFMQKSMSLQKKEYCVMFIIEIPISENDKGSEYSNLIDVQPYSDHKTEDEVILPPGSVFELLEVSTSPDKTVTIKLRLKNEIKSLAHGGLIMQGTLQSSMMTDKEVKIVSLEGEELFETLWCLAGNKLIEEVEFCLCTFGNKSLEVLMEILPTLENAQVLKLKSCFNRGEKEILIDVFSHVKGCRISKVEVSEIDAFYRIFQMKNKSHLYWRSLRELNVSFKNLEDNGTDHEWMQVLKDLIQLESLTIDFRQLRQIADKEVSILASQGLRYLTQLTALTLDFTGCYQITNEGVRSLACQGLKYLIKLASLTIHFSFCRKVADDEMDPKERPEIKYLARLTSLALDFTANNKTVQEGVNQKSKITDKGLSHLAFEGLKYLTQLTSLSLDFGGCKRITKKGVIILANQVCQDLLSSLSFTLYFIGKKKIEGKKNYQICKLILRAECDAVLKFLSYQEYMSEITQWESKYQESGRFHLKRTLAKQTTSKKKSLPKAESVQLRPGWNELFSDSEAFLSKSLFATGPLCPTEHQSPMGHANPAVKRVKVSSLPHQFTSLNLDFVHCQKITNQGMKSFACQGLQHLIQLTSLTMHFTSCEKITDEGISYLCSEGLKYLTQLTSLTLDFEWCEQITDKGLSHLISDGMSYLTQLTFLTIDFGGCQRITDEGIINLASGVLKEKTQLTSLTLIFGACEQITDKGISNFACEGLRYLTQLTSLTLFFGGCKKITDTGFSCLVTKGLENLTSLTSLTLSFSDCNQVTDKGIESLTYERLQHLTKLTKLALLFASCRQITDEGVSILTFHGLRKLTQLVSLNLDFQCSWKITDKGLSILATEGLKYLTHLKSLSLDFSFCWEITDDGMNCLISEGLRNLNQLTSLHLDFASLIKVSQFTFSSIAKVLPYFGFVKKHPLWKILKKSR